SLERIKREIEARRRVDGENADLGDLPAKLAALETKEFRSEVATLFDLTAFTPARAESEPTEGADRVAELAARRRNALLEAAVLGVDLLSETDSPVALLNGNTTMNNLPKKNRLVASELRNLQKNLDGKEIDS
ncbi:MAG: hypothetical protein ACI4QC_02450, partial [Thermoguttaceae bacterium]